MTNAQKQAAWRRRRDEQHQRLLAEIEELRNQSKPADREQELRAEIAELRAKLAAQAGQAAAETEIALSGTTRSACRKSRGC
jgi:hypothetical protein